MPKAGEVSYLRNIGADGVRHAVNKPFSDAERGRQLAQLGAILSLLPPPPARLLDVGCGTGWTSVFFARSGYEVLGVDIAADMIHHAKQNRDRAGLTNLSFAVCDYEEMAFRGEFDCAIFYDSLHHAVDEVAAIRKAFEALAPGGVCVTSEPGQGHQEKSAEVVRKYQVTEKDMPPEKVVALGRQAGFRAWQIFPNVYDLGARIYRALQSAEPSFAAPGLLKRLVFGLLMRGLGIRANGVFPSRVAELYYFKHLARCFRAAAQAGGIVRLVK
jgi:ubiquinone/menaquinone biosynthesis C-methylase UbiE